MKDYEKKALRLYKEAVRNGDKNTINCLSQIFDESLFNSLSSGMENIKTFEDAMKKIDMEGDNGYGFAYMTLSSEVISELDMGHVYGHSLIAFLKLCIIAEALNDDCVMPDNCYSIPKFMLYNQNEYDFISDEDKKEMKIIEINKDGVMQYFAYVYTDICTNVATVPFPIKFKTSELAEYCGKQFIEIWKDLYVK